MVEDVRRIEWMNHAVHRKEERGDERRQEGIRSLPVPAFHLAIHTAAMVMVPSRHSMQVLSVGACL